MDVFEKSFSILKSEKLIEHDKAIKEIEETISEKNFQEINSFIQENIKSTNTKNEWDEINALFKVIKILSKYFDKTTDVSDYMKFGVTQLLNSEYRVRIDAGKFLFTIIKFSTLEIQKHIINQILTSIGDSLEQSKLINNLNDVDCFNPKNFTETYLKAFQNIIKGMHFNPIVYSTHAVKLLLECGSDDNRFAREAALYIFNDFFDAKFINLIIRDKFLNNILNCLFNGLTDNWSQVRMAASVAARTLLLSTPKNFSKIAKNILLPPICLNRHYLAEGVRNYSTTSWDLVTEGKGKQKVAKNIDCYIDFYFQQSNSENHAVREASCTCLAELACLLSDFISSDSLSKIYNSLLVSFSDDSWPVRDTACSALSTYVCRKADFFAEKLQNIFPLFFKNLTNSIPSVRNGAAYSICHVYNTLPEMSLVFIDEFLKSKILSVIDQKSTDTPAGSTYSRGPAQFGVVSDVPDPHYDQIMYSCGSLAPKMRKGQSSGGCSGHGYTRESQPWEITDGCFCLLGAFCHFYTNSPKAKNDLNLNVNVSANENAKTLIIDLLPNVAEALAYHSYSSHVHLMENFLSFLPSLIELVGVDDFKGKCFDILADPIYYAMNYTNNQNFENIFADSFNELECKVGSKWLVNLIRNHYGDNCRFKNNFPCR